MATSSSWTKPPRITAARAPISLAGHCSGELQTFKGRSGSVSIKVTAPFPGFCCTQCFVCALQESLVDMKFDFKLHLLLLLSCCGFSFALGCGVFFFFFLMSSNILLLMVFQQLVVILVVSQEKMSTHPSTLPSHL